VSRSDDLNRLYAILDELRLKTGGYRYLGRSDGRSGWPQRGVYFFFEHGERRQDGQGLRVVRVGTHAISTASQTTLWRRLSQHKGQIGGAYPAGGNHRGSIFRLHVGRALLSSREHSGRIRRTWGKGASADREVLDAEYPLERDVSQFIRNMPLLWVNIPDPAGPESDRKVIEANAIALLSNRGKLAVDPASSKWLGLCTGNLAIFESGLWNIDHVDEQYEPLFLDILAQHVQGVRPET